MNAPANVDDSRVGGRVRDRVTSRVAGNTRPRDSTSTRPVGRRPRPGRMARRCRSRGPASMTWAPVRVGCSVFLNNRYQDAQTGVFLSVDPLVAATGDPYIYAGGNPTTLSDPEGLAPQTCPDGGCNGRDNRYNGTSVTGVKPMTIEPMTIEPMTIEPTHVPVRPVFDGPYSAAPGAPPELSDGWAVTPWVRYLGSTTCVPHSSPTLNSETCIASPGFDTGRRAQSDGIPGLHQGFDCLLMGELLCAAC
jgi:hypothetical protein